jgi:glycosyltransferase involved in cell wall biosynthesis
MASSGLKRVVIIPALNEESSISSVVSDIVPYANVIVVDDGSTDRTAEYAESAGGTIVSLENNQGYDEALNRGFIKAAEMNFDYVVTFDGDGQLPINALIMALERLSTGRLDLVLGVRSEIERPSEKLFNWYANRKYGVPDILCGLKGYSSSLYRDYGAFSYSRSIGTELALFGLGRNSSFEMVTLDVERRVGTPRFGGIIGANARIISAFALHLCFHR